MITRSHTKGDAPSIAVFSECERYRYALTRVWGPKDLRVNFVMLNPSTATEVQNDPTVERCERRARTLGFGGFRVTNILGDMGEGKSIHATSGVSFAITLNNGLQMMP